MNKKMLGIILLIIIIIAGIIVLNLTKEDVYLEVHGEKIQNSTNIFVVTTITDSQGNTIDTDFGKVDVELLGKYGDTGVICEDCPVEDGRSIIVDYYGPYRYVVHYDGGYFFNPADSSGDLEIKNYTDLTYDDITRSF